VVLVVTKQLPVLLETLVWPLAPPTVLAQAAAETVVEATLVPVVLEAITAGVVVEKAPLTQGLSARVLLASSTFAIDSLTLTHYIKGCEGVRDGDQFPH
jgi:hypothetical protein